MLHETHLTGIRAGRTRRCRHGGGTDSAPVIALAAQPLEHPSAPYPGSTAPSSSSSTSQTPSSDTSSGSSKATESQMKACMSAQLSNNSAMSKADAKKYCKSQLGGSPNG